MLLRHKIFGCLVPVWAGLFLCAPAAARQTADDDDDGSPRVERLTFRGAEAFDDRDLAQRIETEQTRCRVWILRPLCAITDWRLIHERHYLDRAELPVDEDRLRVYYFQRGFRHAAVTSRTQPRGRGVEVIFEIDEGAPTIVESVEVEQAARVLTDRQIRRAEIPREGNRLDLIRLADGVVRLADRLGQRGYLDGAVHDTLDVSTDGLRARLRVIVDPGPRSTFGALDISGNERVTDRTIGDGLRLRNGRPLRTNDLVASQRSLYESNLFHEARVRVPVQPDSAKRIEVTVREAPPQSARMGGGFNTVEFVQAEARYTHYNFMGGSRRVELRATLGNLLADQLSGRGIFYDVRRDNAGGLDPDVFVRPTWLASLDLQQPSFLTASQTLAMSVFAHRRIVPGIVVDDGIGAELSISRRFEYRTPLTASYRYELTAIDAGELYFCVNYGICVAPTIEMLRERQRLSPVLLTFISDHGNDPVAPTSGYRVRVSAEHASQLTQSDFAHHRIAGEAAGYYPLDVHRRRVVAARVRAGRVHPLEGVGPALGLDDDPDTDRILHPRKRFYAGGSRSVRGFSENMLGPRVLTIDAQRLLGENGDCTEAELRDGTCDPNAVDADDFVPRAVGGRSVVEASVEYRFPLRRTMQGAVFLDAARVGGPTGGLPGRAVTALTPGAGVRIESPVGPIRVDLGLRPGGAEELFVVTEIVDADGVRRLMPLQTPRLYDPVGDAGGFFRQALRRLTLHLSIGEAF